METLTQILDGFIWTVVVGAGAFMIYSVTVDAVQFIKRKIK